MKQDVCLRCGHTWYRRKPERPVMCPKCKSPYWDKPRRFGKDRNESVTEA